MTSGVTWTGFLCSPFFFPLRFWVSHLLCSSQKGFCSSKGPWSCIHCMLLQWLKPWPDSIFRITLVNFLNSHCHTLTPGKAAFRARQILEFFAEMQPREPGNSCRNAVPGWAVVPAKGHIFGEGKKETPCPKRCSQPWFLLLGGCLYSALMLLVLSHLAGCKVNLQLQTSLGNIYNC